jgi:hypothetical protein
MRSSAHDGLNPRLAWWEWCAEWGDNIDDQALWSRVNPAVSTGRVPVQAIVDEPSRSAARSVPRRAVVDVAAEVGCDGVFDPDQWEALTDATSMPVKDLAIGVDAAPSRDAGPSAWRGAARMTGCMSSGTPPGRA